MDVAFVWFTGFWSERVYASFWNIFLQIIIQKKNKFVLKSFVFFSNIFIVVCWLWQKGCSWRINEEWTLQTVVRGKFSSVGKVDSSSTSLLQLFEALESKFFLSIIVGTSFFILSVSPFFSCKLFRCPLDNFTPYSRNWKDIFAKRFRLPEEENWHSSFEFFLI